MNHELYMHRCLQLASLGAGWVAPNPLVGAVLVYEDRIIGEGWHQQYGQSHAEVNCLASVKEEDKIFIPRSTLYVSLEPCSHQGKTPPCTELILRERIPEVVIACRDPFPLVNGKGIEKLKSAGVKIILGILETDAIALNRRFFIFHTQNRPYIILKWAETNNRKIAITTTEGGNGMTYQQIGISNNITNRCVHRWRSEEASILVGTNTAITDNPHLTTRYWQGPSPIRLVLDMNLRLPNSLHLFDNSQPTIIFNSHKHDLKSLQYDPFGKIIGGTGNYQLSADANLIHQIVNAVFKLNIQSVLVEGGTRLLQSFINTGAWDEARVITNTGLEIENGLDAPLLHNEIQSAEQNYIDDRLIIYKNKYSVNPEPVINGS